MSYGESGVQKTREQLRALYLPEVWRSVRAEPSQSCYWGLVRSSNPPTSFPPKKKKKESEPAIFLNDVWTFLFKLLHLLFSTKFHLKPQQSWQCLLLKNLEWGPTSPAEPRAAPDAAWEPLIYTITSLLEHFRSFLPPKIAECLNRAYVLCLDSLISFLRFHRPSEITQTALEVCG